jgi:hypothetical protein
MSDKPNAIDRDFDPDESPFEVPAIEGIPYKKGSEEDLAIRRVLEEANGARERREARTS